MKINWKAMAASLALLVGVSGAAFGQDFDHQDRDNRARVEQVDRDHNQDRNRDRDRRGDNRWNDGRTYNNARYNWSADHDRNDRRIYRDR